MHVPSQRTHCRGDQAWDLQIGLIHNRIIWVQGYHKDPYEREAGGTVQNGGDKIQMVLYAEVMEDMLPTAFLDPGFWDFRSPGLETVINVCCLKAQNLWDVF